MFSLLLNSIDRYSPKDKGIVLLWGGHTEPQWNQPENATVTEVSPTAAGKVQSDSMWPGLPLTKEQWIAPLGSRNGENLHLCQTRAYDNYISTIFYSILHKDAELLNPVSWMQKYDLFLSVSLGIEPVSKFTNSYNWFGKHKSHVDSDD